MLLVTGVCGALAVAWTAASDRAASSAPSGRAAPLPATPRPPAAESSAATIDLAPPAEKRAWSSIVVHHSATSDGSVASIDAVHRQQKDQQGRPWLGIGYHFVIGNGRSMGDGEVQPTFRWRQQLAGAHAGTREYNDGGIGICLIGNFDETPPSPKQLAAARQLVARLAQQCDIATVKVVRHQDVQATACPGRLFPWNEFLAGLPARDAAR
ncbi:MAG: peptidoglycan recognition family protein [Pirellulales bacterium]